MRASSNPSCGESTAMLSLSSRLYTARPVSSLRPTCVGMASPSRACCAAMPLRIAVQSAGG
eukprot:4703514-Alexandrium_andersonii.AAC.1